MQQMRHNPLIVSSYLIPDWHRQLDTVVTPVQCTTTLYLPSPARSPRPPPPTHTFCFTFGGLKGYSAGKLISILNAPLL